MRVQVPPWLLNGRVAEWQTRQAQNLVFPWDMPVQVRPRLLSVSRSVPRERSAQLLDLRAPLVKGTSCDASNVAFRVRILAGVLRAYGEPGCF